MPDPLNAPMEPHPPAALGGEKGGDDGATGGLSLSSPFTNASEMPVANIVAHYCLENRDSPDVVRFIEATNAANHSKNRGGRP